MKIKNKYIILIGVLILFTIAFCIYIIKSSEIYLFKDGKINYLNRQKPKFFMEKINETENIEIYKLNFETRSFLDEKTRIYALLFIPKRGDNFPGVVFLPAGGMEKEQRSPFAEMLAEKGYAVMTIDQRGIGETGGKYLSLEEDYLLTLEGKEPIQHLSVYDALKSFDVMTQIKKIDIKNIAFVGESMGGRYAIIATALEPRVKGLLVISSSGFNTKKNSTSPGDSFLLSIDPDQYAEKISAKYVAFFHAEKDKVVKLPLALRTYSLIKTDKDFFLYRNETCSHGYCKAMQNDIKDSLKKIFEE